MVQPFEISRSKDLAHPTRMRIDDDHPFLGHG
jgi:hypothetical protein